MESRPQILILDFAGEDACATTPREYAPREAGFFVQCKLLIPHPSSLTTWAIIAVLCWSSPVCMAQTTPPSDSATFDPTRFAIIAVPTIGGFVVGHAFLNNLWWKGERAAFHFNFDQDWKYSLGADKFGHFYFPYIVTDAYRRAFIWSGIDSTSSLYYAAGLALTYQTYIEIRDGFSKQYGFSIGDYAADVLGAAYPIAQHHIPVLRNFNWKISFRASERYKSGYYNAIIDDYESTFHWLTIDVHGLLPEGWRASYPALVSVAVGHGVTNLVPDPSLGNHELFFSLDWNLEALPGDAEWWRTIKHFLNYYHLPAPAMRVYPRVAFFGLKW